MLPGMWSATPGVTGFVGSGNKPIPLRKQKSSKYYRQWAWKNRDRELTVIGENVRVISVLENFIGTIEEIQPDKGKLRVLGTCSGRETPIELDFSQIEKIS